jgi:hypothetical protein
MLLYCQPRKSMSRRMVEQNAEKGLYLIYNGNDREAR